MSQFLITEISDLKFLGAGAFGRVFSAMHPIHGEIAVKQISRLPGETDTDWTNRWGAMVAEGQHLKAAEHERVVRVIDVGYSAQDDAVYLAMELCSGSLLRAYDQGPMLLEDLRDILADVSLGVQVVHTRGLLHRDIKPANLLLSDNRVKLGDFGLVTDNVILGYASAAGYVDHLAPEVHTLGLTSPKTDIWALGMTVYRLLHGKTFYETLPSPRQSVTAGGFASKLPWLPHVPKRWRSLVRKMMADEPEMRYQTASQVLTAVAHLPIHPAWHCTFTSTGGAWSRTSGTRVIEVTWTAHSPRKHEWVAISSPRDGNGRTRRLAGSDGRCGKALCFKTLEKYLLHVP